MLAYHRVGISCFAMLDLNILDLFQDSVNEDVVIERHTSLRFNLSHHFQAKTYQKRTVSLCSSLKCVADRGTIDDRTRSRPGPE